MVVPQSEYQARETIDRPLTSAVWNVCDVVQSNIHTASGVAVRVIEAKKADVTLFGVKNTVCSTQESLYPMPDVTIWNSHEL